MRQVGAFVFAAVLFMAAASAFIAERNMQLIQEAHIATLNSRVQVLEAQVADLNSRTAAAVRHDLADASPGDYPPLQPVRRPENDYVRKVGPPSQ